VSSHRQRMSNRARIPLLQATHKIESMLGHSRLQNGRSEFIDEVLADLRTEGVHVTTVERLLGDAAPAYRQAMDKASSLLAETGRRDQRVWIPRGASTDLAADELLARLPEIYLFGLHAQVLAIAEQYLRVSVAYHGAVLRHSLVDGCQVGPRLWHRDGEDFNVLRSVLYLNDVGEGDGPFEYVPRHIEVDAPKTGGGVPMRTDEEMRAIVPPAHWKRVLGPAGTVVLADSAQTFHHESLQRGKDRAVVMMGHSSRRPKGRASALSHFPVEANAAALARIVPADKQEHVFAWRGRTTVVAEQGRSGDRLAPNVERPA
jgi:hypothetical protein